MADREVIQEFLASLGFQVDQVGLKKFTTALLSTTKLAGKTSATILGIVAASEAMVQQFSNKMERFYYASRRTKASVENLQALEFAARQVGLSSEDASSAIEGFARNLRTQPGLMGLLKNLGVKAEGKDRVVVLNELVQRLAKMPHFVGTQFAEQFGMDEKTFFHMKEFLPLFLKAQETRKEMQRKSGVDPEKAAAAAVEYNRILEGLWEKVILVKDAIAIQLLPQFKQLMAYLDSTALPKVLELAGAFSLMVEDLSNLGSLEIDFNEVPEVVNDVLEAMLAIKDLVTTAWKGEGPAGGLFSVIKEQAGGSISTIAKLAQAMALLAQGKWREAGAKALEIDTPGAIVGRAARKVLGLDTPGGGLKLPQASDFGLPMRPGEPGAVSTFKPMEPPNFRLPQASDFGLPGRSRGVPLGIAQNNPGNLRSWGSAAVKNGFAVFESAQQGLSAMAGNLVTYSKSGLNNVRDIVSKWAPPSDKNPTENYIKTVSGQLGVDSSQQLNLKDPAVLARLMDAMIRFEQGRQPYGTAELVAAAQSRLGGAAPGQAASGVVIHQKTEINVNGDPNPSATAKNVFNSQERVNGDLVRNLSSAYR